MEVFNGDAVAGMMSSDVVLFPDNLTPFPSTTVADVLSSGNHPLNHHFLPSPPPQKLRPIRSSSGRHTLEPSDHLTSGRPQMTPSPELGFPPAVKVEECRDDRVSHTDSGGAYGAGGSSFDAELSSSLDDGNGSQEANKEPVNTKKRKRSREKIEAFLESILRGVMQKQEQMHAQLIEIIENKEKERIMREEAWRKQEIERADAEKQARVEETSRNLALISFIQNFLGSEIKIPKFPETSHEDKQQVENGNQENCHSNLANSNQEESKCDPSIHFEDSKGEPSVKRWTKSETQALITAKTALDSGFYTKSMKDSIWDEVAARMSVMGYRRNAKKCKEKWENMNKYYKRTMGKGKRHADNGKVCTYFSELDVLYQNIFTNSGSSHDSLENENEKQNQTTKECQSGFFSSGSRHENLNSGNEEQE